MGPYDEAEDHESAPLRRPRGASGLLGKIMAITGRKDSSSQVVLNHLQDMSSGRQCQDRNFRRSEPHGASRYRDLQG